MLANLILIAALSAAPAGGTELNAGDVAPQPDAGAPAKKPGLDVSKMPFTEYSIKEVVKFHLPEIQKCYEQVVMEIGGKHPPEGKVFTSFTILGSGLTTKVKVDRKKTTIKNDRIQDCVNDSIRDWQFPKPSDGRDHPIEFPFDLKIDKTK